MDMPANFIENRTYDEIQVGDSALVLTLLMANHRRATAEVPGYR